MKSLIFLTIFLFAIPIVYAADLSDYPSDFSDSVLIVGDKAPALDVISMTSLALSLQKEFGKSFENGLASEVSDPLQKTIISLGSPCDNYINEELLENGECDLNFKEGFAVIQIFENGGEKQIVIAGSTAEDTRRATNVLVNYENYNLNKDKICIFGETADDAIIINCDIAEKPVVETADDDVDDIFVELFDDEPEDDTDEQDDISADLSDDSDASVPELYDDSDDSVVDSDDTEEQTTIVVKEKNFIQILIEWLKNIFKR